MLGSEKNGSVACVISNGIREFWIGLWENVKAAVVTVWNGLKDFFAVAWNGIVSAAQTVWNSLS